MSRLVLCVATLLLLSANPAFAKDVHVNWYICKHVKPEIAYVRDAQRERNGVARAEKLNRKMRKLKNQLSTCRKKGMLKR